MTVAARPPLPSSPGAGADAVPAARAQPPRSAAGRRRRRIAAAKWAIGLAAFVPAARLGWLFIQGRLGANPIAEAMNQLGLWTLILLLASLAMTPLKLLTGWTWPIALRKELGLLAFAYVGLHFLMYLAVDQFFDLGEIGKDIVKRKFITVGFAAFVLLIPLAVTSPARMHRWLGARRWKRLHRLVYVAASLGVVHFIWRVKADYRQPIIFATVLAFLFAVRIWERWRRRVARPAAS